MFDYRAYHFGHGVSPNDDTSKFAGLLSLSSLQYKEAVNTKFKVIGVTRLGIKPESTAPEVDAFTSWPSEPQYS